MRRLQNRDQLGRADRANRGNLTKQFRRLMLPTFGEKFSSHLLAQGTQRIELLVVEFRPATNCSLGNLAELFRTIPWRVDLLAGTRNSPTAVQGFDARHYASLISTDR